MKNENKTKPYSELTNEEKASAESYWDSPENQGAIDSFMYRTRQSRIGLTAEQRYNFGLMVQGLKEG